MAIVQCVTNSFKLELLSATHNFSSHTFKLALYSSGADLGPDTEAYTASGEVSGTGYSAGGATLTVTAPAQSNGVAYIDIADVTWSTASFTARGGLIYNSSASDKAVAVINFGNDRICSANDFVVSFPDASTTDAIVRIS